MLLLSQPNNITNIYKNPCVKIHINTSIIYKLFNKNYTQCNMNVENLKFIYIQFWEKLALWFCTFCIKVCTYSAVHLSFGWQPRVIALSTCSFHLTLHHLLFSSDLHLQFISIFNLPIVWYRHSISNLLCKCKNPIF